MATSTQAELDFVQAFGDMLRASQERNDARLRALAAKDRILAEGANPSSSKVVELVERAITDSGLDEETAPVVAARIALLMVQTEGGVSPSEF